MSLETMRIVGRGSDNPAVSTSIEKESLQRYFRGEGDNPEQALIEKQERAQREVLKEASIVFRKLALAAQV